MFMFLAPLNFVALLCLVFFANKYICKKITTENGLRNYIISSVALLTVAYWAWESQAEGNIRVDLLVLYPFLLFTYTVIFWKKFKWLSLLFALLLMLLNFGFAIVSYDLFNKYRG